MAEFLETSRAGPVGQAVLRYFVSILPLLLFLMTLLGLVLQSGDEFQNILRNYIEAVVPQAAATRRIDTTLGEIGQGSGPLQLSTALLFSWWSATQGMLAVVKGVNNACRASPSSSAPK